MDATALERLPRRALLDGAVGTELMARGLRPGTDCPERWNVERADVVGELHRAYWAAGCDAVQTNSFGANRVRLATYGRAAEVEALNRAAVSLARASCPPGRLVIGSLGPTGLVPPPEGDADLVELEEAFAEQAAALAGAGADLLHVETLYHPKEGRAAMRGVRQGAPGVPVVASMTCQITAGGYVTPLGFPPERMLAAFLEEGADGVGVNCTLGPAEMLELVRLLRGRTDRPIFAQPTVLPASNAPVMTPGDLVAGLLALAAVGASAVGGCCGSRPADLAAVRRALDAPANSLDAL